MNMGRISWEQYFMAQAKVVSLRGTCTRLNVGAIIVRENRIIASGYNGSVADSSHCIEDGWSLVYGHCVSTIPAEAIALFQCAKFGFATKDTDLYVTHYPCLQCTKQLIQAGLKRVFYEHDYRNHELAVQLFAEANVETIQVAVTDVAIDHPLLNK